MNHRWWRRNLAVGLCACLPLAVFAADDPAATQELDVEAQRSLAAQKNAVAEVRNYEFLAGDGVPVDLHPQPVLKWSNPAAGSIHGNVFLWTKAGRPFAAGSVYQWFSPFTHRSHEFVSMATAPLTARYQGPEVWSTIDPGVTLIPLKQAPTPAASSPLRLVQMRSLMRQFSATKLDRKGGQQELRPLMQPVYRYHPSGTGLIDGGLFAFVQGTDPEVWLMLEAHERDGKQRWEFAATRMNSVDFTLRREGELLWHTQILPWGEVQSHRETYTSFTFRDPVK